MGERGQSLVFLESKTLKVPDETETQADDCSMIVDESDG